jgi:hypothetical protein
MTAINYLEDGEVANDTVLNRPLREALTAMGQDPDDVLAVLFPDDLTPYYTSAQVDVLLATKAALVHTHDDRYYTESEIDAALADKAELVHTHDDRYYTETEVDTLIEEEGGETEYLRGRATLIMQPDSTTLVADQANGFLTSGSFTVPAIASTSMITANRHARLTTTAATNQAFRATINGTGDLPMRHTSNGGFRFEAIVGLGAQANGQAYGCGVHGSVNPQIASGSFITGITDCVYFGFDAGDALPGNWILWHNDNAGNATKVDTGVARDTTSLHKILIVCDKTGNITASMLNPETGSVEFSQVVASNLPTSGTLLLWGFWGSTVNVATSMQIATVQITMVVGTFL